MILLIQAGSPFFHIVSSSHGWETLSNAPVRSRLRTETILAGFALQAALVSSVRKVSTVLTDLCFHAPN